MCGICGFVGHARRSRAACDGRRAAPSRAGRQRDLGRRDRRHSAWRAWLFSTSVSAGHQPMATEDGGIRIVYNGEVYNFAEQRRVLEASGVRFRSTSDTEVVLRLYERFGDDFVVRLRGMFAMAIWDARRGPGLERLRARARSHGDQTAALRRGRRAARVRLGAQGVARERARGAAVSTPPRCACCSRTAPCSSRARCSSGVKALYAGPSTRRRARCHARGAILDARHRPASRASCPAVCGPCRGGRECARGVRATATRERRAARRVPERRRRLVDPRRDHDEGAWHAGTHVLCRLRRRGRRHRRERGRRADGAAPRDATHDVRRAWRRCSRPHHRHRAPRSISRAWTA